jgi:ribosomal protein S13
VGEAGRLEVAEEGHRQAGAEGEDCQRRGTLEPYQEGEEARPCQEGQHQELPCQEGKPHIRRMHRIHHRQAAVRQEGPVAAKEQHSAQYQEQHSRLEIRNRNRGFGVGSAQPKGQDHPGCEIHSRREIHNCRGIHSYHGIRSHHEGEVRGVVAMEPHRFGPAVHVAARASHHGRRGCRHRDRLQCDGAHIRQEHHQTIRSSIAK